MTAGLVPTPRFAAFDANGNPLVGGLVNTYVPGSTTPKTTWQDAAQATPNSNPIVLDAAGSALFYGSGAYQVTVTDAYGNAIAAYSGLTAENGSGLLAYEASVASLVSSTAGAALVGYLSTSSGAVGRTLTAKLGDIVSVKDFGAVGNGSTDDTAAIQAAITASSAGNTIWFPAGTYKTTATLTVSSSGITLAGAGKFATTLKSASTNAPVITVGGFLSGTVIRDMTIDRSVVAVAGGNGINAIISTDSSKFVDLIVQNQWAGMALGPTGYSLVENCVSTKNLLSGFLLQNTAASGAVQWSFFNCLASRNTAAGYQVSAVVGPAAMALGEFVNCSSFANSGPGLSVVGLVTCPINGVRITGGFFGQDGTHEVYLDTYGGEHKINGTFTELAGTGSTGTLLLTAASHVGGGFTFTVNNIDVQLEGCYAEGHSQSGYISSATEIMVSGCKSISNGMALTAGDRNGFYILAGRAMLGNVRAGNIGGTTSQLYGIQISNGASGHVICGADLTGNVTATFNILAAFTNTTIVGVVPGGNIVLPVGGVMVGAPTGGAVNGAVNVEINVLKNNVAYNNP